MEKFGQYILLEKVAIGGMAELFKAKKVGIEGFERVLAIKRILPHISSDKEFIDMFIAEAKLVAHLSHKNVAQIYDFGKIGQNYFIAMEYIRGKDLRTLLARCQETNVHIPVDLSVFIAKEVLSALGYAHKQKDSSGRDLNLIHRDVSPQNILISYEGEIKVIDFGIAKAETHSHTKTGMIKGKIAYMSPEQAWGKPIDHRSDIFSLGIVLYEMITGSRLFKGTTEINTLEMVREAKVEPFPPSLVAIVPSELESMVMKALSKDLQRRYQDASYMESDLGNILFTLSSADPGVVLKKFMNDLFCAEIEAECRAAAEQATLSIKVDQKAVPIPQKTPERKTQVLQKREPQPEKKTFSYIVLAAAFISIIVAVFLMWPDTISEKGSHTVPPSKPIASLNNKVQAMPESTENGVPLSQQPIANSEVQKPKEPPKTSKEKKIAKKATKGPVKGNLTINAIPWAEIYINGQHYGTTPKTINTLKVGDYSIRLENPNYDEWTTKVTVLEGRTANVSHKFEGFGKIVVNAVPWGNVYLDGELKGQTPITLQKVPARVHEIIISREGYTEVRKSIEIKTGSSEQVSVKLQRKSL
jgi:serine/threonine protein kinase